MKWFFRLPLLVRIPLLAAVMIFLIAMAVTQMAIISLSRQYEIQTERIGQVYLDGLSAAVERAYENRDIDRINEALSQSLSFYLGIVDRQLALIDRHDGILAHVAGPNLVAPTAPPNELFRTPTGYVYETDSRSIWVWRELGSSGIITANLDTSAFADERALLRWRLLLIGAALSIIFALGGYLVIRNLQRPLGVLSKHLSHAVAFGPHKIDAAHIPEFDQETYTLMHAYNRMVEAVQDREQLTERLATQDRQALLGHIAASLAHEIRNPLTGIMTALQTIRMYGQDTKSRNEALEFIDRGIQSLQGVARATLDTYRPSAPGPALELRDLHDVVLLVEPHAARNAVTVHSELSLNTPVELDAFKVRQVALNLLLNAIQTSPPGGNVRFRSRHEHGTLSLTIEDDGPGLPTHAVQFLLADSPAQNDGSLGLETVRRLTHEMGGRIRVSNHPPIGSAITLEFVLSGESAS